MSDAVEWDGYWLWRLFEAANRSCPIKLRPFELVVRALAEAKGADRAVLSQTVTRFGKGDLGGTSQAARSSNWAFSDGRGL